ncbi:type II restriction endonuclease [Helicobacter sp. 11S02596-1]|uniref:type II restriction endonuclease n=1 Tax=Helicobacter sp. 11S02596-1 TaxID=1476194 RepID=UPI000BA69DE1|nr:type II restriction endonuclease [Helicobacter sp. 11S02596-1]PAF44246.1 restriction endonuclease [Helicobacter sp. 11S02596-1]
MINKQNFEDFLVNLKPTLIKLGDFSDFNKCFQNTKQISMHLYALNYLLGKEKLKEAISSLFEANKACFSFGILNLLIAVRDNKPFMGIDERCHYLNEYFNDPESIYNFFVETGLDKIFQSKIITNLNDYVFGIEVGMDTNARKNRGGRTMEKMIADKFKESGVVFKEQVHHSNFDDLNLGLDKKVFDFVIETQIKIYLIECNFYSSGGSKLNETARSYREISSVISQNPRYEFVWITDGKGWLGAKNKLAEAYESVRIYNLANLFEFISELK